MNRPARKRFGQNFLIDEQVIQRIIDSIGPVEGELLIEIGPGRAALTESLLQRRIELIAVEIDRDLAGELERRFSNRPEIHLHNQDALQTDFGELAQDRTYRLLGNLPYNISTPLIFHVLSLSHQPRDMHFMLQKEVVKRMAAVPGSKAYGRLTVMCQNLCEVQPLFEVGPESFDPRPKVESSFVRLVPRKQPLSGTLLLPALDKLVKQAFSLRRKTLRNGLASLLSAEEIQSTGIDPAIRAEQLSLNQFFSLAALLDSQLSD